MNAPAVPPVDLKNLVNLRGEPLVPVKRKASKAKAAGPVAVALLAAAGVLVWRLAPLEVLRRRRASRSRAGGWIAGGAALGALAFAGWQLQRVFNRQPAHQVESRLGLLEIRRYPSVRVAETTVDAKWEEALELGFGRLAGFIGGGNREDQKIAMTSPVLGSGAGDGYRVSFFLPDDVVASEPDDHRVELREVPPRRVAVLRFNGRYDTPNIESHKRTLAHELAQHGLHPKGEAWFAGYDPPWTLPLLRRVELWVEIEPSA